MRDNLGKRKAQARARDKGAPRPPPAPREERRTDEARSELKTRPEREAERTRALRQGRRGGGSQGRSARWPGIRIVGGQRLTGTIPISGAKNAALPLMIASLLTAERLTLKNVPNLADVNLLARILRNHGVDLAVDGKRPGPVQHLGETFHLTARDIVDTTAPYEMVSRMRASFWVLGPLLARMGEARVSLPGGCAIGTRPVDLHLTALKALGAEIEIEGGYVVAKAPGGALHGAASRSRRSRSAPRTTR